jgi:hypothetical protein
VSNETLQTVAVAAIVLAAVAFLAWRRVRRRARPTSQCGNCPACGPPAEEKADWSALGNPVIRVVRRGKPTRG